MRLFTRLSAEDADQAARGALRGDFLWVDNFAPDKPEENAVWISIEVPDVRLAKFETRASSQLGCREFLIPSRITNLHRVDRVQPPI